MTVQFSPEAESDFAGIIEYLVERNPAAAAEMGQRIFALIDRLWVVRIYSQSRLPIVR